MKVAAKLLPLVLLSGIAFAQFPSQIKNVIVIFQENRTPDNLFHFLTPACPIPAGATGLKACTPTPVTTSCYDISPCGVSNQSGTLVKVPLVAEPLAGSADPDHSHNGFENMCDPDPATQLCRNDGAWHTSGAGAAYGYVDNPVVTNSDGSTGHLLDPYLTLAKQYGWANFMYQTNQGPSYPAHQFIFAGTSALTASADTNSTFVASNFNNKVVGAAAGCLLPNGGTNVLVSPALPPTAGCTQYANGSQECTVTNNSLVYPTNPVGMFCVPHTSMADILDPKSISWKYYAPSAGSIWTAPDAIQKICQPQFTSSTSVACMGAEWNAKVDVTHAGTDILRDIASCNMAQVNWVIPNGAWSDHPGPNAQYGPSWVATVINALGNNPTCAAGTPDAGQNFWQNTAIVVTWDDWGGWSDNQPANILAGLPCTTTNCQGDYQYGFRVPMLVVSAYTPSGTINNLPHDFGSILRMIEGINGIKEGALGFADARSTTDLSRFFTLTVPRTYQTVPSVKDATYFLGFKGAATAPDND